MKAREKRLEDALRAATKLRRAIEQPTLPLKAFLVPAEAVREYDEAIEKLKEKK